MTDSDATVIVIPPVIEPEPVIVADPEPATEVIADAIEEVAEIDRMLDHESRIAALEATIGTHTHPEYEQAPVPIAEPIVDDIPAAPIEPEEIAAPEPVEDSKPNRSHPLFARPFGNG
jgi:hypothetical protein